MGRNFYSVCHKCKISLMHFRGREGDLMQRFANLHSEHEKQTEIYNDYVEEPPDDYVEVDNPTFINAETIRTALTLSDEPDSEQGVLSKEEKT